MAPNSGPLVGQSSWLATEGGPLVDQKKSLSLAADSGPLKDHQKTLLSATNSGPLSISQSRQWLATIYSQCRMDSYAAGGSVVSLQSLTIWGTANEFGLLLLSCLAMSKGLPFSSDIYHSSICYIAWYFILLLLQYN